MCLHNIFSQELCGYVAVDSEAWETVPAPDPERHHHRTAEWSQMEGLGVHLCLTQSK